MEALLGLAILVVTFALLRRLTPRPDRAPLSFMRLPGADTTVALLLTATLALGIGLTIDGGFELWQESLTEWAALK